MAMSSNPLYADYKNQQKKYREQMAKTIAKGSSRESAVSGGGLLKISI